MEESKSAAAVGRNELEKLLQRASKDSLSGLLNRATMEGHIKKKLSSMQEGESCAAFIIDLDDFKLVNDTLGHQAGDMAIRQSAQILSHLFRASDIIGRLGGDEFAVFVCGKGINAEYAGKKGAQICEALQLSLGEKKVVNLTASVGIYVTGTGEDFEMLYKSADIALYKAKKEGKHTFRLTSRDQRKDDRSEDYHNVNAIPINSLLEYLDSGVAMVEFGDTAQIVYVSPSYCRLIGKDYNTFHLPVPLASIVHPDDIQNLMENLYDGLKNHCPVEHTHRVTSSSGWKWWHIRAVQIDTGSARVTMLVTTNDVTLYKENEVYLEDTNERLQTAFDQTSQQLWEVDIRERTFTSYWKTENGEVRELTLPDFPSQLISRGFIHQNSIDQFRQFASQILAGQSQGYGNFMVRYHDSTFFSWAALSYRTLYDDVGHAVRAIGIEQPMSATFSEQGFDWIPARLLPEALLSRLVVHLHVNLTRNKVEEYWMEGRNLTESIDTSSPRKLIEQFTAGFFRKDSGDGLFRYTAEDLVRMHEDGRHWVSKDMESTDRGGNIRKVRHVLHLVESAITHDVYMNAYVLQIPLSSRTEKILREGNFTLTEDAVLYDKPSIEKIASAVFSTDDTAKALAVFQINGLAGQTSLMQETLIQDIAASLSLGLGGNCIVGRYGIERLLVIFPHETSEDHLRHKIDEVITFIRRVIRTNPASPMMRFVVGVAVQQSGQTGYGALLANASYACSQRWNAPVDTVSFANESEDKSWTRLENEGKDEQIAVLAGELSRPLSEGEKDVAFNCMGAMLSASSLENSILGVLRNIGLYYNADRVYILSLAKDDKVVTMPYEWDDPCKRSIQQVVSGMMLKNFHLLERCIEEKAPVFLTRTQGVRTEDGKEDEVWHYTTFPLSRKDRIEGFLCIENARKHPASAALFSTLIPYIMHEEERFRASDRAKGKNESSAEQLMGMPDLRSYMATIYTLNSDKFTSLGAVCIDIPAITAINNSKGFEYGSRLLWYVSKSLADIFGPSLLFRTWDAEFIAFCANTTKQVFLGRCARLNSILQRRYPRDVRIGCAWADGVFTGRRLVDDARSDMNMNRDAAHVIAPSIFSTLEDYSAMGEKTLFTKLAVYYQPIVNMNDGSLISAEALVRGIDENGALIPPSRFIGKLEEHGSIRELDLYVLDEVLSQSDRWRKEGFGILPVCVNFSRVTLTHPSILASTIAIQSRYPDIPADMLSLEITENADAITDSELKKTVDSFRSYGFRVCLDDFGSRYANLSLFTNVTFDTVKLDRSLITQLADNEANRMLVKDLVQIGKGRGMRCVAEGVETQEQIRALLEIGCNYAQGYYYDKPMNAQDFREKYLLKRKTD